LYFALMAFICGCRACIRFMERVLAWVSGQKTTLMMTVMANDRPAIGQTQRVVQRVHRQQERLGEEAEEPAIAHHQVDVVVKAAANAGERLVFLWSGEQEDLVRERLAGRESLGGIDQRPSKPRRRRVGVGQPRLFTARARQI